MLKKYTEFIAPANELKNGPSTNVINALLNYSKSLEVKKVKKKNVLIHLN
jgi:CRISPR/Cas system-associated endonuclease Cas1